MSVKLEVKKLLEKSDHAIKVAEETNKRNDKYLNIISI